MQKAKTFAVVLYLAICSVALPTLADKPDSANSDAPGRDSEKDIAQVAVDLNFIENELVR